MSGAGIVGMGLWLPDEVRGNDAWPASFVQSFHDDRQRRRESDFTSIESGSDTRRFDELFRRHAVRYEDDPFKGAVERRVAPDDLPSVEADARAAVRALEDAEVDAKDVDLVLSSAQVPDRLVPGNGPAIQHLTGCVNAAGISVESYCSAALAQLDVAAGLVQAGRAKYVLCVQSHLLSRANDLEVPLSPLFGDASSAFVVGPTAAGRGLVRMCRRGDGALAGAITWVHKDNPGARWYAEARGAVHPGTDDIGAARLVTANLIAYALDTIEELCERSGFDPREAAAVAMVQLSAWFQAAVADGLDIPQERVPTSFSRVGHIGAAGVVANLLEARSRGLLHDGAPVLAYAHGAGLTRYAALMRWHARS